MENINKITNTELIDTKEREELKFKETLYRFYGEGEQKWKKLS